MTLSGKEKRRQRTLDDFLNAAEKLIIEQGVQSVSVSNIAEEAGYGKGTIYQYFQNKEDLLLTLFQKMSREMQKQLKSLMEDIKDPAERLHEVALTLLQMMRQSDGLFIRIVEGHGFNCSSTEFMTKLKTVIQEITNFFSEFFDGLMEEGYIQKMDSMRLALSFLSILSSLQSAPQWSLWDRDNKEDERFVEDVLMLLKPNANHSEATSD